MNRTRAPAKRAKFLQMLRRLAENPLMLVV